jgi:hypothetical protein
MWLTGRTFGMFDIQDMKICFAPRKTGSCRSPCLYKDSDHTTYSGNMWLNADCLDTVRQVRAITRLCDRSVVTSSTRRWCRRLWGGGGVACVRSWLIFSNFIDYTVHHEGFVSQFNDQTCDLSMSNAPIIRCLFQKRDGQDVHQDVAQATSPAIVSATSPASVPAATFSEAPTGKCRPQSRIYVSIVNWNSKKVRVSRDPKILTFSILCTRNCKFVTEVPCLVRAIAHLVGRW